MNPLKNRIKHFWFTFRDLFIPKSKGKKLDNSLVIIRLDAIGDYILFRNFLESIRKSTKYKDYHITLIGNKLWKPLAESLDSEWIDRFIWVDLKAFHKSLTDRKASLLEIEDTCYDILFHPTYSRDYYVSEVIAERVNALTKFASAGDLSNIERWQKIKSDKTYTFLHTIHNDILFEFDKNKAICNYFIDEDTLLTKPSIDRLFINDKPFFKDEYIILFIGGSAAYKKWNLDKWIGLIILILKKSTNRIIISGAPDEFIEGEYIKQAFQNDDRLVNYCGKSSMVELISLISHAKFMISNETVAPHIAVSLDIPLIVLSIGIHFGRFTPYPERIFSNYKAIFPPEIDAEKDIAVLRKKYATSTTLDINDISVDSVYLLLKKSFLNGL